MQLLRLSEETLDILEKLPSITHLDQILFPGNYFCKVNFCDSVFDTAYELRDHSKDQHNYCQADWGADSPSILDDQEVLAIALEWATNANGHPMATMKRNDEVLQTAWGIMLKLGRIPDFERDFEAAAGI